MAVTVVSTEIVLAGKTREPRYTTERQELGLSESVSAVERHMDHSTGNELSSQRSQSHGFILPGVWHILGTLPGQRHPTRPLTDARARLKVASIYLVKVV